MSHHTRTKCIILLFQKPRCLISKIGICVYYYESRERRDAAACFELLMSASYRFPIGLRACASQQSVQGSM